MSPHPWLSSDLETAVEGISGALRDTVHRTLRRKGAVVAISGGVGSAVCAALAVVALGSGGVFGLLLSERDSSPDSLVRGEALCRRLGIARDVRDITPTLEAIGCYRAGRDAIRAVFPDYGDGWRHGIVTTENPPSSDRLNVFRLVVRTPDGEMLSRRLPPDAYLELAAAADLKRRIRKTIAYYHAGRLHYAVVGAPSRLEYDQGVFVKDGDGSADVKPIAHLYKSQVHELARRIGLPEEIRAAPPATDTHGLEQGRDEFFLGPPHEMLDVILFGLDGGRDAGAVAAASGLRPEQVERVFQDIRGQRRTIRPLRLRPLLAGPVPEITV